MYKSVALLGVFIPLYNCLISFEFQFRVCILVSVNVVPIWSLGLGNAALNSHYGMHHWFNIPGGGGMFWPVYEIGANPLS